MLRFAIVVGLLLIAVSVASAVLTETPSLTLWIPGILGAVIALRAWWGAQDAVRLRFAVWAIRSVALIGLGASVWRLVKGGFDVSTLGHQAQAVTAALCLALLLRSLRP